MEQQQVPKDLEELVALKYIASIPSAPRGKKFVIDRRKVEVRLEALDAQKTGALDSHRELRPPIASKPSEGPA